MATKALSVLLTVVVGVVVCGLTLLATFWWPAWIILAAAYFGILAYFVRLTYWLRKHEDRQGE